MAEEKNDAQESENTEVEATTENEENETLETTTTDGVDYKAELEKAQSIIRHKEDVIKQEKEKRLNMESSTEESDDDYEDPIIKMKKELQDEVEKLRYQNAENRVEDEINRLANSQEEADLIRFHVKNSVRLGSSVSEVKEGVKLAWLKANESKILSTNMELAEALKARNTTRTTSNSSGQSIKSKPDNLSGDEKRLLDKFTLAGENISKSSPNYK